MQTRFKTTVLAFNLTLLGVMLAVGLSSMASIMLRYVPFIPLLLKVFIMKGCCISSNAFSASVEKIVVFIFHSINVVYHIY